ncbi:L,D-transpeptidase family protein [Gallaecimonas sp. GXIMD4217]|uniref:L,D-transpeptidase family protein n=1 Tax=Gallaecimonas sp. GXIMD4217 TaxID=3131927 RepID=UPI00311ACC5D
MKWFCVFLALLSGAVAADWLELRQTELALAREKLALLAEDGPWPVLPERTLKAGVRGDEVALLGRMLLKTGDLESIGPEPGQFDLPLEEAVRAFQRRHGLDDDGVVGPRTRRALNTPPWVRLRQVDASLARMAAFRPQAEQLVVNVPAFELEWWQEDKLRLSSRIIVGRPSRPSPLLSTAITGIELNPPWNVPYSIFRKDYLWKLRQDPGILKRQYIDIVTGYGRQTQVLPMPDELPSPWPPHWRLRQRPGRHNALGLLKFVMPNDQAIYLHHTNQAGLFKKDRRAFSSGCIRVEAAFTLAEQLLADRPQWRELLSTGEHLTLALARPLPVALVYWTAWVDQAGRLQLRDDLYGWDGSHFAQAGD